MARRYAFLIAASIALAQAQPAVKPQFEVATVKRSRTPAQHDQHQPRRHSQRARDARERVV